MAKYDVTRELAEILRTVRVQNHISAKELAEHIEKSQSYVSKLENGDVKTIDEDELSKILLFIFKNETDLQEFLDSSLGTIFKALELRFSEEEIKRQMWFDNYDTVIRKIPVPGVMIDNINLRMNSISLSIADLCKRINANEQLPQSILCSDKYPSNTWCASVIDGKINHIFIKMQVEESTISAILNKEQNIANYVTVLAIVLHLIKIELYGSQKNISEENYNIVLQKSTDYLNGYKFYSIRERERIRGTSNSIAQKDDLLSSFDKENLELINKLLTYVKLYSDLNILAMNSMLSRFVDNLQWDGGFMWRLLSIPISDNGSMSFTQKKRMLQEIEDIINKFAQLPKEQKELEIYN